MNSLLTKFIYIFLAIFVIIPNKIFAGPLNDLKDSNLMQKVEDSSSIDEKKWFRGHPILESIFIEKSGPKMLANWIGEGNNDFFSQEKYYSNKIKEKNPIIKYKGRYVDKERENLFVYVFVPHPKIASTVEIGLNETINKLSPPKIPVFFQKQIEINSNKGMLYLHKSGACSILINLPSGTRFRTYKKDCKDKDELMKFTKGFDINRLKMKLTKPKIDVTE